MTSSFFRCKTCGQHWLTPKICCHSECLPATTQRTGTIVDSASAPTSCDFSLIFVLDHSAPILQSFANLRRQLSGKSYEFIFVWSSLADSKLQSIADLAETSHVRSLRVPTRAGLSQSYNLAAQAARGKFLVLVDCNAPILQLKSLAGFADALNDLRVGLVGNQPNQQQPRYSTPRSNDSRYAFTTGPLPGPVVGLRAETFWQVGGLDESFKTHEVAMQDLQYRLIRANYRLASIPTVGSKKTSTRERDLRQDQRRFASKHQRQLAKLRNSRELFGRHPYPKLSVAIATRNYGVWLRRCLDSILKSVESETPLQIVVTDDCSTDHTQLILETYRKKYPAVMSTLSPRTSAGVPLAKNLAIRRASGDYIALHDADDEFYQQKVSTCLQTLSANPGIDLLSHDYRFVDSITGETFVPRDEWFGDWRPPGVWIFRAGVVNFNEQMICGYEELDWAQRCWSTLRRVHVPATLTKVHGQYVSDRWKVDRDIAGLQSMVRWRQTSKRPRGLIVFACEGCGNQYFHQIRCCDKSTLAVPLVCYMAIASPETNTPVEFSIVVFTGNSVAETRKLVSAWHELPEARDAEWIFVGCRPRKDFLSYFREFSRNSRTKVVLSPAGQPTVYAHDANRGVRCANGRIVLFLKTTARPHSPESLALIQNALLPSSAGMVGVPLTREETAPLSHDCYGLRRDVFWELGAMDERFEGDGLETLDLQYRALRSNYHLVLANLTIVPAKSKITTSSDLRYLLHKHGLRRGRSWSPSHFLAHLKPPQISVVLATHNEARFLAGCLASVMRAIRQAGVPVQVVVVNDCSTDDTRLILEQYRQRFPEYFTVIHNERRVGPARAHNQGLARSVGVFVAGIETEYRFRPAKLKQCLSLLRKSSADFLFHSVAGGGKEKPNLNRALFSTWMFRAGVVGFNEQIVTGRWQSEWLRQQAQRLKTIYLPLRLTSRGRND